MDKNSVTKVTMGMVKTVTRMAIHTCTGAAGRAAWDPFSTVLLALGCASEAQAPCPRQAVLGSPDLSSGCAHINFEGPEEEPARACAVLNLQARDVAQQRDSRGADRAGQRGCYCSGTGSAGTAGRGASCKGSGGNSCGDSGDGSDSGVSGVSGRACCKV